MARQLVRRWRDAQADDGATAVEYGIIVAGIAVLCVAALLALGPG